MRRIICVGLAAALAAAVFAVAASAQTTIRFSVLSVGVESHQVSNDVTVFHDKLVEPGERSEVLGRDRGRCRVLGGTHAHCRIVFFLAAGKVKVSGRAEFDRRLIKLPVVGGTRAYNGVGGKAIIHNAGNRNALIDFTLVK
jgi:hypothetical protein